MIFLLNLDFLSCCVFVSSVHFHMIDFPAHSFYSVCVAHVSCNLLLCLSSVQWDVGLQSEFIWAEKPHVCSCQYSL